ncbi:hypothetical protein TELCIR_05544 [Teladorsagia circumcincta]|uniref:acid phosphatase n=1 Tax=Teladorsagia circumcincta TaxID=45464 RepID=A0A2G9UQH1_TELCI|nr:hypothetical protein TELCIR_05544 [Teladorsagia circumcincta]
MAKKKPKKQGGSGNLLIFALVALVLLIVMAAVVYVVFFVFKGEDKPAKPSATGAPSGLITAIALFHHGARAPLKLANVTMTDKYPNGPGELTEIHFRSRSINRCLMSGAVVGSGMWAHPVEPDFTAVPIYGQENDDDHLLAHLQHCASDTKRYSDKCQKTPPSIENWAEYEGFVFECIGLNKETELFKSAADFAHVSTLIQDDQNGLETSEWFKVHREEIYKFYHKTYNYIVGVHDHHNKEMLKLKQGVFMKKIHDILKNHWAEFEKTQKIKRRKFIAYSTVLSLFFEIVLPVSKIQCEFQQKWLLMAFLDALGCGAEALRGSVPTPNALVVIELLNNKGAPEVQVLFKDGNMDSLKDVTASITGCNGTPCALSLFHNCCDDYMTEDPKAVCGAQS